MWFIIYYFLDLSLSDNKSKLMGKMITHRVKLLMGTAFLADKRDLSQINYFFLSAIRDKKTCLGRVWHLKLEDEKLDWFCVQNVK
jgi:hypothetical protein